MEQPGDMAQVAELHCVLQLLLIERPPLAAANTPSICQRGHTARVVTSQPAIGAAEADSVLGGQIREAAAFLPDAGSPAGDVPAISSGHWGGYAWASEVEVAGSHLNP